MAHSEGHQVFDVKWHAGAASNPILSVLLLVKAVLANQSAGSKEWAW